MNVRNGRSHLTSLASLTSLGSSSLSSLPTRPAGPSALATSGGNRAPLASYIRPFTRHSSLVPHSVPSATRVNRVNERRKERRDEG